MAAASTIDGCPGGQSSEVWCADRGEEGRREFGAASRYSEVCGIVGGAVDLVRGGERG